MAKLSIVIPGELRSERIALLVTPTLRKKLEKVSAVQRTSMNNVINDAIETYLDAHQNDIQRFNDFFGEER